MGETLPFIYINTCFAASVIKHAYACILPGELSVKKMYELQGQSFVIQVREEGHHQVRSTAAPKVNLSPMRLFDRFRKIIMHFIFSLPSRRHQVPRQRAGGEHMDPPKTSCSSYHYMPNSHYNEAIADCIEFFNKSSQEATADALV